MYTSAGTKTLFTTVGNVLSYTDSALTNGVTYFYKVTAVNSVGESSQSSESSTTSTAPAAIPSAPQTLQSTGADTQVSLTWDTPSSNGGASITGYKIYRSTSSGTETLLRTLGNSTSFTDFAVANGVTYFYKVTAVNSVGESTQSSESSATPATTPSAPQNLQATGGNAQVSLTWQAPSGNGGSPVTN